MFCYVCGELTVQYHRCSLTPLVKKAYALYFGWKFGDQDKFWALHICCGTCANKINEWLQGSRASMHFALPILWWEQIDRFRESYFSFTKVQDFFAKSTHGIRYLNLPSGIRPVPRDGCLIPNPPIYWNFDEKGEKSFSDKGYGSTTSIQDPDYEAGNSPLSRRELATTPIAPPVTRSRARLQMQENTNV